MFSSDLNNIKVGIVSLTHSSRKTDFSQCSKESLQKRYASPERLKNLIPFEKLPCLKKSTFYTGGFSLYFVLRNEEKKYSLKMIGSVYSNRKIQHAVIVNEKSILIIYESLVELWKLEKSITKSSSIKKTDFIVYKEYNHPHFSGLHTGSMISEKTVVISASASDAILVLDLESGEVRKNIRMPKEIYGENYEIFEDMDLREHYINNDIQIAHLNCAYPDKNKNNIIVSALIPGAIGRFSLDTNEYVELLSGHIGCHGARVNSQGNVYFSDSTEGKLMAIEENGKVKNMYNIESKWLHDSLQIDGDIYAFSVADKNELRVIDIRNDKIHYKKKFFSLPNKLVKNGSVFINYIKKFPFFYGNSTQFLDMYKLN